MKNFKIQKYDFEFKLRKKSQKKLMISMKMMKMMKMRTKNSSNSLNSN
jgi:hypothetical protein